MVIVNGNMAQGICCPIVCSLLVFLHELKQSQYAYPPMPSDNKIGCSEDISQMVVVGPYYKWHISKILFEVLCDTPLRVRSLSLEL